jgi:hypothetical protein
VADDVVYTGFDPEFGDRLNRLIARAKAEGYAPSLISGVRSAYGWPGMKGQTQAELYSQLGKPGGPRAAAPPGYSPHQYGLAGDVTGIPQSELERLAPEVGLRANHSDPKHVELANWQNVASNQAPSTAWDQTNPANVPSQMAMNMETDGPAQPGRPATPTPVQTTMFGGLNAGARGMRNNNPGNLVANDWTASLPGYKGSDGRFAIFDTPQHGALALDQNLAHYGTRGINTPLAIASTWAPASDNNNPSSYGAQIAKGLGVGLNDNININDPAIRAKVAQAIGLVENGPGKSTGFAVGVPGTTINTSGAPTAVAGGPGAAAAPGQPGQGSGGFAGSPAGKMLSSAQKTLGGDAGAGGGEDSQPSMPSMQLSPPQAVGGQMMIGPGGQNTLGRNAAQQMLAQAGFQMQPSFASYAAGATRPVVPSTIQSSIQSMPPSQATGLPGLPGTTLNSPSQLQMALMTGALSPYDLYSQQTAYGGGIGS